MTAYTDDAMLPDLRPLLADILDGIATRRAETDYGLLFGMHYGAETLRWSAARETTTTEELEGQISHLVNIIEEIEKIVDRPGGKIKEIREVVARTWA